MTQCKTITLKGCHVETIMHYLKSLGAFKILTLQKNPDMTASWNDGQFCLHIQSQKNIEELKRELVDFLLFEYHPTPIVTPWNGGGGFVAAGKQKKAKSVQARKPTGKSEPITVTGNAKKANTTLINVENSTEPRLKEYGTVIKKTRDILRRITNDGKTITDKKGEISVNISSDIKQQILQACRNYLPDTTVSALDAMYVLTSKDPKYNPLLGSGGNDGNLEFIDNFRQNLLAVFAESQKDTSRQWIMGALFGDNVGMEKSAMGQFNPGCMFAPNMTNTDVKGTSLINPWDYILMIEGAILFAGGVTKHLSMESTAAKASFPFTVSATNAGYATSGGNEKSRGEIWVPTWERPTGIKEIQHLFGESRAQIGRKQAASGSDFARAVIGLGVEKGIAKFYRFGIRERNGMSNIMMPMGDITVRKHVDGEVLFDLDSWMDRIKRMKNMPNTIESHLRILEGAILDFTMKSRREQPEFLQKVLIAVGKLEMTLSVSLSGKNDPWMPQPVNLSTKWISQCYDNTPEFRLAASLASIGLSGDVDVIRTNIEAITLLKNKRPKTAWATHNNSVVKIKSAPEKYLAAILNRRMIDTIKVGGRHAPIQASIKSPLPDVIKFLRGELDLSRIVDLFIPLSFIEYNSKVNTPWENKIDVWEGIKSIPYVFAIIKMAFLPHEYEKTHVRLEPSILPLLEAGRISDAFSIAQKRLFYSGFKPILYANNKDASARISMPKHSWQHLSAALLFPLENKGEKMLMSIITGKKHASAHDD